MSFFSFLFALFTMFSPVQQHGFQVHHAAARPLDTVGGGIPHLITATPAPITTTSSVVLPTDTVGGGIPH